MPTREVEQKLRAPRAPLSAAARKGRALRVRRSHSSDEVSPRRSPCCCRSKRSSLSAWFVASISALSSWSSLSRSARLSLTRRRSLPRDGAALTATHRRRGAHLAGEGRHGTGQGRASGAFPRRPAPRKTSPKGCVPRQISRPCAHAARQKRHHAASWRPCTPPWRTCAEPAFPARSRRPCVLLASLATPAHRPLLNGRPAPRNGERHCRASEAHARRAALPPTGRAARGRTRKGGQGGRSAALEKGMVSHASAPKRHFARRAVFDTFEVLTRLFLLLERAGVSARQLRLSEWAAARCQQGAANGAAEGGEERGGRASCLDARCEMRQPGRALPGPRCHRISSSRQWFDDPTCPLPHSGRLACALACAPRVRPSPSQSKSPYLGGRRGATKRPPASSARCGREPKYLPVSSKNALSAFRGGVTMRHTVSGPFSFTRV